MRRTPAERPPAVETVGLTKFYGSRRGIEDVSFRVDTGETFGLLGPNGAGKTTLIRTVVDLLHPTRGTARVFGLDSHREGAAIRARLGNLPGDFGYGKRATGRSAISLLARLRGISGLGRAPALAERFDADLDRPLGELSRGNRQKVGLITALFHEPDLLILDEPTSGLDPLMQEEFLALVGEERERGCSVVISSHELDEVERVCERVGIIRTGRLVAAERVADLSAKSGHRVSVEFAVPVDAGALRRIPGVGGFAADGPDLRFTVTGDLNPVLEELSRHPVADLEISRPTLEEIFLTYYGQAG